MSILVKRFSGVITGVVLILIGVDVALIHYGVVAPSMLAAVNLVLIALLLLYRGFLEGGGSERKYYFIWSLLLIDIALAVLASTITSSGVVGLSILIVGLGLIVVYAVK
ncbi:MAG: hypothetical protein RMI45_03925 [Ignisphaera sp.]|nr:hypothetical protein [Ignisphaera sp.]MDW8085373.1 hypothetical protein [Ignisphaera sp.]